MKTTSPYLTAAQLGVEPWIRDGLIALVPMLVAGELNFHMQSTTPHCGSAGCLGGWVNFLFNPRDEHGEFTLPSALRAPFGFRSLDSSPLAKLFYPNWFVKEYGEDVAEAAIATRDPLRGAVAVLNFLTLGDPKWDDVMSAEAPASHFSLASG